MAKQNKMFDGVKKKIEKAHADLVDVNKTLQGVNQTLQELYKLFHDVEEEYAKR